MRSIYRISSFWIGTLLLISFSVISCSIINPPTLVQVTDTKVKNFSAKKIEVDIILKIKNPNNFKVTITKSQLTIFLNKSLLGETTITKNVILPKNSSKNHTITLSMDKSQLSSNAFGLIMSATLGGRMNITVNGFIKGRAMMISKKVPIEFSHKIM